MSIAVLIRRMAEAGATAEAIALAVEAIEQRDAAVEARRAADRERKQRQRDRQRDVAVTVTGHSAEQGVPETSDPSPLVPPSSSPRPPSPPPYNPPSPRERRAPAASHRFAEFWAAYPRKADKRKAEKAWESAIKRADPEAIIRGARAYAAERASEDPQFTKHPTTWLNADAWANDPEPTHGRTHDNEPQFRNGFAELAFRRAQSRAGNANEDGAGFRSDPPTLELARGGYTTDAA